MELLKQNKGKIVEKNYPESKSSFKKPSVLVKNNQDNKKNYIKFMALMKKKPTLYVGNPIDAVKWAKELVNLYKSLK